MIRSGSTLQYNIIRGLVEAEGIGCGEGWIAPDVIESYSERFEQWGHEEIYHIVKSHFLPRGAKEMVETGTCRICYIYRDIRDVAFSSKTKWGFTGERLVKVLDEAVRTYDEVSLIEPILMQKYEIVMKDIPSATREIADYLGFPANDTLIDSIAEENSLERAVESTAKTSSDFLLRIKAILLRSGSKLQLDEILRRVGMPENWVCGIRDRLLYQHPTNLLHPDHISKNKGAVGVWKYGLTADEIQIISNRFRRWLCKCDYE